MMKIKQDKFDDKYADTKENTGIKINEMEKSSQHSLS